MNEVTWSSTWGTLLVTHHLGARLMKDEVMVMQELRSKRAK